jgi:AraC family transcriptional regulator
MDWHSSGRTGHIHTRAGSMILLAPGTHDSLLWHGPSDRIVVSLEPLLLLQAAEQLGLKGPIDFENCWSFQDKQLALLLTEMEREMRSGWAMGSLYGDLLGASLSTALLKKYAHASSFPTPHKGGLSRPNLRRVLSYIEANLRHDLRLSELASIANLSIFHFARSFRESTGGTPHQYITQRRVQTARALLHSPEWSIQQIASATGFIDASQFTKLFKRNTGVTPSVWRSQL